MATPLDRAEIGLTASLEESEAERSAPDPDSPFRILILGDFSARASRGIVDPSSLGFDRLPLRIDRDTLDEAMEELGVELRLNLPGKDTAISLRLRELDDFHPDRIFERSPAFQLLRRTRENLEDPSTFEEAAAEVRSWGARSSTLEAAKSAEPPPPQARRSTSEDLVAEMLESARLRESESAGSQGLDSFVRKVVEPHLVSHGDSQKQELLDMVDAATGSWMRNVLRDPDFQALEAAWRGLDFLVRRLETDTQLQVFILDVSKAELAQDLRSARELSASATHKILVEQTVETAGVEPWSVIAGLYTFDQALEDVALLGRLAKLARAAGAPFMAAASPHIVGCDSLVKAPDPDDWRADAVGTELWEALRGLPEASYLGLALPRFLLRLPYGRETDPIDQFAFEEFDIPASHEDYLWGNPAIACLCVLGQAFSEQGWTLRPGAVRGLENLPLHTYKEQGEVRLQSPAEIILTDRAVERCLDRGLMPLLSAKGRDSIRLGRLQSIADPPKRLAGNWG